MLNYELECGRYRNNINCTHAYVRKLMFRCKVHGDP